MTDLLSNDAARIALMILLFVAVAAVAFGLTAMLGERREVRERLVGSSTPGDAGDVVPNAGLRVHDARGAWVALVTAIEKAEALNTRVLID